VRFLEEGFRFRYYLSGRRDKNADVMFLLIDIKKRLNVDFEFRTVNSDPKSEEKVYREDLKPREKILRKSMGRNIHDVFWDGIKYRIVDRIVVVDMNDNIVWCPHNRDPNYNAWRMNDQQDPLTKGFLIWILSEEEKTINYIKERVKDARKSEHDLVIEEFKKRRIIEGLVEEKVKVGEGLIGKLGAQEIDFIVKEPSGVVWVGEAKPHIKKPCQLYEALGQVLIYKALYKREYPDIMVKTMIICRKVRPDIEDMIRSFIEGVYVDKFIVL